MAFYQLDFRAGHVKEQLAHKEKRGSSREAKNKRRKEKKKKRKNPEEYLRDSERARVSPLQHKQHYLD